MYRQLGQFDVGANSMRKSCSEPGRSGANLAMTGFSGMDLRLVQPQRVGMVIFSLETVKARSLALVDFYLNHRARTKVSGRCTGYGSRRSIDGWVCYWRAGPISLSASGTSILSDPSRMQCSHFSVNMALLSRGLGCHRSSSKP
jgi:hypothetical protein